VVRGVARTAAVAGTATVVSGRVRHHQDEKYATQQQEAYDQQQYELQQQQLAAQQAAAQQPAAPAGDDLVTQLEKLGKLRDEGLLTDEEFAAQKAKLLG
jgi:hypothetical protein